MSLGDEKSSNFSSATGIRRQNFVSLDRLADCIENDSCGPGEETVVILASYRFAGAEAGGTGGEEVWARSTMQAFRALNYTIIMTWGHMDTLMVYQRIPEMVPIILWEQGEFKRCQERNDENYLELEKYDIESPGDWQKGKKACMQTEEFPEGIPWWKSFMFLFWAQFGNPLGGKWVVAPEDYTYIRQNDEEHHYLGYSIEHRCMDHVTFSTREHRALILAKNDEYFEEDRNLFVGQLAEVRDQILPATIHGQHVKFDLLSTSGDEIPEGTTKETAEKGIFTIGRQPQKDWVEILARSKVLLGIGRPQLSPSPYDALCLGVPFINPVLIWDHDDPDNRVKWETQQDALKYTNEPYVYHVRAGDKEALASALQRAVDNPIGRYIPEPMRMENVIDRHRYLVEHDWQEEAKAWVHENHPETEQEWKYLTLDMPEYDAYGHIRRP